MSDDSIKPERKVGGFRKRADGAPRATGGRVTSNRGGMYQVAPDREDNKAACRALYEGTPGATCAMVAERSGVPEGTVRRWKAEGKWRSVAKTMPDLSGRAGALANSFKTKMSELGKPMSDEVAVAEATKAVVQEYAVDVRAEVLDRHRKEWAAPRNIIYDAMKSGNFDRAKLGKISAETLQIIQAGECRAYGMDHAARGADGSRTMVLIDRDGNEVPEAPAAPAPAAPAAAPAAEPEPDSDDEEF